MKKEKITMKHDKIPTDIDSPYKLNRDMKEKYIIQTSQELGEHLLNNYLNKVELQTKIRDDNDVSIIKKYEFSIEVDDWEEIKKDNNLKKFGDIRITGKKIVIDQEWYFLDERYHLKPVKGHIITETEIQELLDSGKNKNDILKELNDKIYVQLCAKKESLDKEDVNTFEIGSDLEKDYGAPINRSVKGKIAKKQELYQAQKYLFDEWYKKMGYIPALTEGYNISHWKVEKNKKGRPRKEEQWNEAYRIMRLRLKDYRHTVEDKNGKISKNKLFQYVEEHCGIAVKTLHNNAKDFPKDIKKLLK